MILKACIILLCVNLVTSAGIKDFFTTQQSGLGMYYGSGNVAGSCSNFPIPAFAQSLTRVALSIQDFKTGESCGMCIEIQGDGSGSGSNPIEGPFIAFVNDVCADCKAGDIDIASDGDGSWGIKWKAVSCPTSTALTYRLEDSNNHYIKLIVSNHRQPIASVELLISGQKYKLERTGSNTFILPSDTPLPITFPLDILVTGLDGTVVSDTIPTLLNGQPLFGTKNAILPNYNLLASSVCSQDSDCPLPGDPVDYTKCNFNYNINNSGKGKCDLMCRIDSDCRFGSQDSLFNFCINGKCKINACKTNDDCNYSNNGPVCDTTKNECRKCKVAKECATNPAGKVCLTAVGFEGFCGCNVVADCVGKQFGTFCHVNSHSCGCQNDLNCKVINAAKCNLNTLTCGNCSSSLDCKNHPNGTTCVTLPKAQCAAIGALSCTTSTYGSAVLGDFCGCRTDKDCLHLSKTPSCNCVTGKCIECTKDHHCPSWKRCNDAKKCVALKCGVDDDCFRTDLRDKGFKPFGEARCNDKLLCIETPPLCVAS